MHHVGTRSTSVLQRPSHAQCSFAWCLNKRGPAVATASGRNSSSSSSPSPGLLDDGSWGELPTDSSSRTQRSGPATDRPSSSRARVRRREGTGSSSSSRSDSWNSDPSSSRADSLNRRSSNSSSSGWYPGDSPAGTGFSTDTPQQRARGLPSSPHSSRDTHHRPPPADGSAAAAAGLPGDWTCPDCGQHNFARRQNCYSCGAAAPAGGARPQRPRYSQDASRDRYSQDASRDPGDWECTACGDINFRKRSECRSCQAPRPAGLASSSSSFSAQPGDWTCPACGDVNFARRQECRSCQEPRPKQAISSSSMYSRGAAGSSSKTKGEGRKKAATLLMASDVACCYGCGAPLQTEVPAAAGYVAADKFEVKKKHKQLKQVLCGRCSSLAHGAMIPAVKDFTQKAWLDQQRQLIESKQQQDQQQQEQHISALQQQEQQQDGAGDEDAAAAAGREPLELLGKVLVTAEELRDKIAEVSSVKALVVMLVDLLDVSGTLMGKVRDMVGNNPIVLVGTKLDLLPDGSRPKEVATWLTEAAARRRLQVTSTHLISSRSGEGVAAVASKIARERKGRDVFVVGAANVGKSAFVRALLREMSSLEGGNFDAAAAATRRYLPVESAMPGTTLGIIPLQAFETGGTLFDTPGVHLHHRVPHMLTPDELKLLHPRRRLVPFTPPTPLDIVLDQLEEEEGEEEEGNTTWGDRVPSGAAAVSSRPKPKVVSASYLWSGLVRLDVLAAPPSSSLVFYGPSSMRVVALPLLADGQQVELDLEDFDEATAADDSPAAAAAGENSTAGDDVSSSSSHGGSKRVLLCRESVAARGGLVPHTLRVPVPSVPSAVCVADVAVSGLPGWVGLYAPFASQGFELKVWVPRGVEVFLRPPMPCPPPPKPLRKGDGGEEEEGLAEDLEDIGKTLEMAEADQDWELHRDQLGLRPMSKEDEEVMKLLLYGNDAAGLTGIMDMEEEGLEEEDEGEEEVGAAAAGTEGPQHEDDDAGDIASIVGRALQAEQLAATAAEAIVPRRRGNRTSARTSSEGGTQTGQGVTIVLDDEPDADATGQPSRRRRRQR